jgi:hypothetical protein
MLTRPRRIGTRSALTLGVATAGLVAISVLAPAAALAAPAASRTTQPNTLALKNHWVSEQGTYDTGDPMYAVDGNKVVHLSGSIAGGTAGDDAFVLPAAARPASDIYIDALTSGQTVGYLYISTSGDVYPEGSSATSFTSLSGISFPAAASTLVEHGVSLQNGWTSENSTYDTGDPTYAVDSEGIVHISGSIAGTTDGSTAFVLPFADRPSKQLNLSVYTNSGTYGAVLIATNGDVVPYGGNDAEATVFTSLAGITFRDKGSVLGSANQKTENDWVGNTYGNGPAAASRDQYGFVHLSGGLNNTNADGGTGQTAFVLPAADRPAHYAYQSIFTQGIYVGQVTIEPSGDVLFYGASDGSTTYADSYSSLSGVTFEAGF